MLLILLVSIIDLCVLYYVSWFRHTVLKKIIYFLNRKQRIEK